ncbi:hypothetical protein LAZ40_09590 [Cereibacter sphaeroides]|uniref:hypothetical protein n=1 Tax=Cereibacter sphaeroides TaxID=1063 RepID=UPI001F26B825|nr:hypothetical protein [Cereibacter sphaeroides]MCE6959302.1 hypothetical protein [Cereibacter sphaeroides]MCE6972894.1 hypothetical protein [Cereibacter sphaeroides]
MERNAAVMAVDGLAAILVFPGDLDGLRPAPRRLDLRARRENGLLKLDLPDGSVTLVVEAEAELALRIATTLEVRLVSPTAGLRTLFPCKIDWPGSQSRSDLPA